MTAPTEPPTAMHAPDSGSQASNYILFEGASAAVRRFYTHLTWSFHLGDTGEMERWGLDRPLPERFHDDVRDALAAWAEVSGVTWTEVADGSEVNLRIGVLIPAATGGGDARGGGVTGGGPYEAFVGVAPDYVDFVDSINETNPQSALMYNVLLHEVGHALLIDHSDVEGVVMSGPPYSDYTDATIGVRDELQPDDIAAVQAIWGPPASVPPDLEEEGESFVSSGILTDRRGTAGDDIFLSVPDEGVPGWAPSELFAGGFGADRIEGSWGDDTLLGNGVYWTNWNNPAHGYWSRSYTGADDGDTILGGSGHDFINGNAGLDSLDGGPGNDTIYGGQNEGAWTAGKTRTNTIHLREGHDTLKGGEGDDWMNGNMGRDILHGGPGFDWIRGGQDEDLLYGEAGWDTLWGDLEGDTLDGGPGADHIILGNDTRTGDGHVDHVHFASGEADGDVVYGLELHDVLWIDGAIATQAQVEALGVTFVPIAQV